MESFGFNYSIRDASKGIAYPQLVFHGYEVNREDDPLFIPKTKEELEDHGEGDILVDNLAKKIIEKQWPETKTMSFQEFDEWSHSLSNETQQWLERMLINKIFKKNLKTFLKIILICYYNQTYPI